MTIDGVLKKAGFSEKEIEVYVALLKLGSSVVSDIAKKAGINRSTTYVILAALIKRGLVSTTERRGVKVYNSISPEQLVQYLEGSAKQYAELAGAAKELLPKLKQDMKKTDSAMPRVQIFEGVEGVRTVYEDALSSLESIRAYASEGGQETVPDKFLDRLAKKNLKVKMIYPESAAAHEFAKTTRGQAQPVFAPEISIYENKVVFVSPVNQFALVIESQELAEAFKKAFDFTWEDAKRSNKKPFFGSGSMILGGA